MSVMTKIGVVQFNSSIVPEDNLSALFSYAQEGVNQGADLIVTPECTNILDMNRQRILSNTTYEEQDFFLKACQEFCNTNSVSLLLGSLIVKVQEDRLANRSILINKQGQIVGRYDKIHLFDVDLPDGESYRESALYEAGNRVVSARLDGLHLGMTICYDLRFPYLYRALADEGVAVIFVPAAFTVPTGKAHWHSLLRARAIENGCYIIAPAQSGMHQTGRATYGHSLVVDPWGEVLLDAGGTIDEEATGVYMVDVDSYLVDKIRSKIPSLQHTRSLEI
ncbi:carbon-nitrogen hydrolase family protein [Temperatibacter marinus]|uniref:Carbon-nitrogen hydrolase family protein n=1 Tax=Temperatibacter marinus TaxID=1456591 RepID=A0AA52H7S1_9PROT|nr:carbon-nitrogen hydrolase family protein [Temperatibacter marinus]WND01371.1 carbon-nitrogen hydrolase family protein [Temperatibacter marinus]